ncbi:DNA-binding protein [Nakamurella silvestris]|nr:DNA-binding protein [Nakamurella silvestris]
MTREPMLTTEEIGATLRKTPRTIAQMLRRGEIPGGMKIGRRHLLPAQAFEHYLATQPQSNQ